MRRWLPHKGMILCLTLIWLLLANSLSLGNIVLGALLGWLIVLLSQHFLLDLPPVRKPWLLCRFVLLVFYDIVVANLQVAKLVLGPGKGLNPAFVEVPMAIENDFLLAVLASIVSLTPGTVSAGLSADHKVLLLHGLDVRNEQALIDEVKSRYEAPLLEIFQCSRT
ncbi:Na+/H+ antiporter subunit E [Pseudomonas sp. 5P_3.1_Bac2]|uniref:Na+/H+ antiporter subunit E n=1 Tax=Pseudomonas sp. 5P_3.1_Bac2 TaxID=2971617 RepID=UPI0021CA0D68|nr:Na+/H+ antiporter subunit E [Pseudomonas sp. 5P_3.1_Bac2]MCU1716101.1 Na+/H+ antiporter subunit E [Pseudomonas sp. 5P_3.1_Bac2]